MTHTQQLETLVNSGMIKSALGGALVGKFLGSAFGKGLTQSGKMIGRNMGKLRGNANRFVGEVTGNAGRVAQGVQQVAKNTIHAPVPGAQVTGSAWNPMNQIRALPQRFKNTGKRIAQGWGAAENGISGIGGHAAYAAGRLPAALTYGGAAAWLPYTMGDYAGSYSGARSAQPHLMDHAYDEATGFMDNFNNMDFMSRMRAANDPQQFGAGMIQSGDPVDQYSVNAYRQMYDPSYQNQTGGGIFREAVRNTLPVGMFMGGQGDNYLDQRRNFIQRRAAREMAESGRNFFQQKSATVKMNQTEIIKAANIIGGLVSRALMPMAQKAVKPLSQTLTGMVGKAALPATMLGIGYMGSKHNTEQDMYSQARGTARAGIANYWSNMSPMQRYGAAMFPQAAKMRMEKQLGPGYRQFYNQHYGQPGQQSVASIPPPPQQQPQRPMLNQAYDAYQQWKSNGGQGPSGADAGRAAGAAAAAAGNV